jgi:hypothetical protein
MTTNYNTSYLDYSTLSNYTGLYKDTTFQYMKAKDNNSWDGASIKSTKKQFDLLDKNGDGQIDYEEAVALGGLFGKNNFALTATDNPTGVWKAISHDEKLSLREFAQVALFTDGTKSTKNPNNVMDGIITAEESNDVMVDLAEKTRNPASARDAALLAYNTVVANGETYDLSKFIPKEKEQYDALQEEKTVAWDDKVKTTGLLEKFRREKERLDQLLPNLSPNTEQAYQVRRDRDQLDQLLRQLQNNGSVEQKPSDAGGFDFGQMLTKLLPALIGGLLPVLFGGGNSGQGGQQQANPLAGLLAGLQGNA